MLSQDYQPILDYPDTDSGKDKEENDLTQVVLSGITESPFLIHQKAVDHGDTGRNSISYDEIKTG